MHLTHMAVFIYVSCVTVPYPLILGSDHHATLGFSASFSRLVPGLTKYLLFTQNTQSDPTTDCLYVIVKIEIYICRVHPIISFFLKAPSQFRM
ncbi:hypothetical protein BDV35DRAFT_361192 [Aspergillus flavus]|uniref:Uncharacterized protein n=1 Tax=Aspergillus flavus TaxID=5059 RepID=A0A5N6GNR7_ASPFL|nr:hypothetical protein BDV35DRAFT_361192 [Aspergillus flavus]